MKKMKTAFLFLFILLFQVFCISRDLRAEMLFLKDHSFLKGQLVELSRDKIIFLTQDQYMKFNINDIDVLLANDFLNYQINIKILKQDQSELTAVLHQLTAGKILFYDLNSNQLSSLDLNQLRQISLSASYSISKQNIKNIALDLKRYNLDQDIHHLFQYLNLSKKADQNYYFINVYNTDYYDQIWSILCDFLDDKTKSVIWSLLEIYSEKEKLVYLIQSGQKYIDFKNMTVYQSSIYRIREEFFLRIKKIILILNQSNLDLNNIFFYLQLS